MKTNMVNFKDKVSIHAPAWGATWTHLTAISLQKVSIHAPAWGATRVAARTCG